MVAVETMPGWRLPGLTDKVRNAAASVQPTTRGASESEAARQGRVRARQEVTRPLSQSALHLPRTPPYFFSLIAIPFFFN